MDIIYTYPANYGTEFPVHGFYPNHLNTLTITENSYEIQTEPLAHDPAINIVKADSSPKNPLNPDLYFLHAREGTYGIDSLGDTRYHIKIHNNYANKIIYTNDQLLLFDSGSIRDLLGNYKMKFSIGHDIVPYKNGSYIATLTCTDEIAILNSSGKPTEKKLLGDLFRDIIKANLNATDKAADELVLDAFIFDSKNPYKDPSTGDTVTSWAGSLTMNALVYDKETDFLYVSSRNHGVLKIKYKEWKLIWWMVDKTLDTGKHPHFPNPNTFSDLKSLEPYRVKGAGFDNGPKNQHALLLRANDNLAMFDNQGDKWDNPAGSRFIEYKITGSDKAYTASKVQTYRDPNRYSNFRSDVDLLRNDQLLISYSDGKATKVVNYLESGQKTVFEMTYNISPFRNDKMPLYPYNDGRKYPIDFNEKLGL